MVIDGQYERGRQTVHIQTTKVTTKGLTYIAQLMNEHPPENKPTPHKKEPDVREEPAAPRTIPATNRGKPSKVHKPPIANFVPGKLPASLHPITFNAL